MILMIDNYNFYTIFNGIQSARQGKQNKNLYEDCCISVEGESVDSVWFPDTSE